MNWRCDTYLDLLNVPDALHIRRVAASAEDDSDLAEDTVRKGKDVNAIMG